MTVGPETQISPSLLGSSSSVVPGLTTELLLEAQRLLHEAAEVYCYYSCLNGEPNKRLREIWERFLAYELGQLHFVMDLFRSIEKRDPAEVLPKVIPEPFEFGSHRDFLRQTLAAEVNVGPEGLTGVGFSRPEDPGRCGTGTARWCGRRPRTRGARRCR